MQENAYAETWKLLRVAVSRPTGICLNWCHLWEKTVSTFSC